MLAIWLRTRLHVRPESIGHVSYGGATLGVSRDLLVGSRLPALRGYSPTYPACKIGNAYKAGLRLVLA